MLASIGISRSGVESYVEKTGVSLLQREHIASAITILAKQIASAKAKLSSSSLGGGVGYSRTENTRSYENTTKSSAGDISSAYKSKVAGSLSKSVSDRGDVGGISEAAGNSTMGGTTSSDVGGSSDMGRNSGDRYSSEQSMTSPAGTSGQSRDRRSLEERLADVLLPDLGVKQVDSRCVEFAVDRLVRPEKYIDNASGESAVSQAAKHMDILGEIGEMGKITGCFRQFYDYEWRHSEWAAKQPGGVSSSGGVQRTAPDKCSVAKTAAKKPAAKPTETTNPDVTKNHIRNTHTPVTPTGAKVTDNDDVGSGQMSTNRIDSGPLKLLIDRAKKRSTMSMLDESTIENEITGFLDDICTPFKFIGEQFG